MDLHIILYPVSDFLWTPVETEWPAGNLRQVQLKASWHEAAHAQLSVCADLSCWVFVNLHEDVTQ